MEECMSRDRRSESELLLSEWACLGILFNEPSHGFAIAQELRPDGVVGRVWSVTRPLTYRALEQLQSRGYVEPRGEVPGTAGGNRTMLAVTRAGRAAFRAWLGTPVVHLRDLRSELLLKLVLAQRCGVDVRPMLKEQRRIVRAMVRAHSRIDSDDHPSGEPDVVMLWRREAAEAALRFLSHL